MTSFDFIALAVLGLSALTGFLRGAVNEIVGLFAFTLSALVVISTLRFTTPVVHHLIHSGAAAAAVAAVASFVAVFMVLRLLGSWISGHVHRVALLGSVNRIAGLTFGALRGFLILGLFTLVFNRITPVDLQPRWIVEAAVYPLAVRSGHLLGGFVPRHLQFPSSFPALREAVESAGRDSELSPSQERREAPASARRPMIVVKPSDHRYSRRARDSVDALVERSQ